MALASAYTVAVGRISDLFDRIRDGQAPDIFSRQLLRDWGFTSSNDRAFIPLLKALGFLSPDGKPTSTYHDYRDHSRSKAVLGHALREAYSDIFLIKEHPTEADRDAIQGKFKSYHNVSDHVAGLMTRTFLALLKIADTKAKTAAPPKKEDKPKDTVEERKENPPRRSLLDGGTSLHYNIQIHLPATKDVEVYAAIFKALREHLVED